jgi:MFS family permease
MESRMKEELNQPFWYIAIAGLCVLFTGIGLCRFAYTPLIPVLIHEGWVDTSGAGYLGAINLIGYLLGAFLGQRANKYFQTSHLIKYSLVASVISLGMCAINWNFAWFAIWRFVAGMTGALIMVMTPAAILKSISIRYRGRAAGLMFTGIGFGIIVSGFLFPSLAKLSVSMAWLSAAVVAFAATVFSWRAFPSLLNHFIRHTIKIRLHYYQLLMCYMESEWCHTRYFS